MNRNRTRKGFTTVELVIVIAVIAILATVLIPNFANLIDEANESAALQEANIVYQRWLIGNAASASSDTTLAIVTSEGVYLVLDNALSKTSVDIVPCSVTVITHASNDIGYGDAALPEDVIVRHPVNSGKCPDCGRIKSPVG